MTTRFLIRIIPAAFIIFSYEFAFAELNFPVQARLFAGVTNANPTNVNSELNTLGISNMKNVAQYGMEVTYPLASRFEVGLRYTWRSDHEDDPANINNYADLNQNSAMLVGRIPLLKTKFIRFDGFAGFGGTNTTLSLNTPSQNGEITRQAATGWFASPCTSYGGSVAVGFKKFFVVFEGGYESNKVTGLSRSSTLNNNIQTIDLSGTYFTVGFLFDGVNATEYED